MSSTLSSYEQVAQAMLLLQAKDPTTTLVLSHAVSAALGDVFDNNPSPSSDDINQATKAAIQSLGFVTDPASVASQHGYLDQHHAGYWSGNYAIVDSAGGIHSLLINAKSIRLLLDGITEVLNVPSEGAAYSGRKLTATNDKVEVAFTLSTTIDGIDITATGTDLEQLSNTYAVLLTGNLTIKGDNIGVRTINGKRGVSTPAGVLGTGSGEPPWIWVGEYDLRQTDTEKWDYYQDSLVIAYDTQTKALTVCLGALSGADLIYRNNVICFTIELTPHVTTRVTMSMTATSGGSRKCFVWFDTTGHLRTLTGYARTRLDEATLWPKLSPLTPGKATNPASVTRARLRDDSPVDFCLTPYDSTWTVGDLVLAKSDDNHERTPTTLFSGDTLKVGDSTLTGVRVNETDHDGNETGRVIMFTLGATNNAPTVYYRNDVKLKSYQELGQDNLPQPGAAHCMIGIVDSKDYELPTLVETDFYEVRFNISDYVNLAANGLSIAFAIEDPTQPRLLRLHQPNSDQNTCPCDSAGNGPDPGKSVADYTKASVLVRCASGETEVNGFHDYYFSVAPKGKTGFFAVKRTVYKLSSSNDANYVQDGDEVTVDVPVLLHVPIEMDSRDALEWSGNDWPPAARNRSYTVRLSAMKGLQPFTWKLVKDDRPAGLNWVPSMVEGIDYSDAGLVTLTLTGTISNDEHPGQSHTPCIRVMSNKKCVMQPLIATPSIPIIEPDTEYKNVSEWSGAGAAIASAITAIAVGAIAFLCRPATGEDQDGAKRASDTNVQLTDMADRTLSKTGSDSAALAKAQRQRRKDKRRIQDLKDNLERFKSETRVSFREFLETTADQLNDAKTASERRELEGRLRGWADSLERFEKENNGWEEDEDSNTESESSGEREL